MATAKSRPQIKFLYAPKSSVACGNNDEGLPDQEKIKNLVKPILMANKIKNTQILYDESEKQFGTETQKIKILKNGYISILPNKALKGIAEIPEPYNIQPNYKIEDKEITFLNGEKLKFEFMEMNNPKKIKPKIAKKNQVAAASNNKLEDKLTLNENSLLNEEKNKRLFDFNDEKNEIQLCEYKTADGKKFILLWSKFMEQGIFLDKDWYYSLTKDQKKKLFNSREEIFVEFTNNTKFKGKWLKNEIFGNGEFFKNKEMIEEKNEDKIVKGFWIDNRLYFDFEVELPDDFTDEDTMIRAKNLLTPMASSDQILSKENKNCKFKNQLDCFKTKQPHALTIEIEGKEIISTSEKKGESLTQSNKNDDKWQIDQEEKTPKNSQNNTSTKTQVLKKIIKVLKESEGNNIKKVEITYPNQDKFSGEIDLQTGFKIRSSKYISHEGYTYEGGFLNNKPFGRGILVDCFNNTHNNFFFDGFILNSDHGIQEAYGKAKAEKISDIDFYLGVKHPELGRGRFEDFGVNYETFIFDIEMSKKGYQKMIENIQDGEQDYEYNWEDHAYDKIVDALTQDKLDKQSSKTLINGSGENKKEKDRFDFLKKLIKASKVKKMSGWKKKLIIEAVKDQEYEDFKKIYDIMKSKNFVFELFNIKNEIGQNLPQIAAKLGYRQFFIDMLTAAYTSKFTKKQILKIFGNSDKEHNSLVDLTCIKGYDLEEELFYCQKKLRKNPTTQEEEYIPEVFIEIEEILPKTDRELFSSEFITSERIFKTIQDIKDSKQLNTHELSFLTKRAICLKAFFFFIENYPPLKEKTRHSKIPTSENIMKKLLTPIKQNSHTPLHFTLYHADLHSTILILQKNPMLIFRQRKTNPLSLSLPQQFILSSGFGNYGDKYVDPSDRKYFGAHDAVFFSKNKWKSMSIFISLLEEITQIFNYSIIKNHLIFEIDESNIKTDGKKGKNNKKYFSKNLFKGIFNKIKFILAKKEGKDSVKKLKEKVKKEINNPEYLKRVENISDILSKTELNLKNIDLYKNEYILLSDELSKSYIKKSRKDMSAYHLRMKNRYSQNLTPNDISPFEVTQKLILEFMPDSLFPMENILIDLVKPLLKRGKMGRFIDNTLQLITWYLTFLGDAPVDPKIFRKFNIDLHDYFPLGEKNLIHIMCENNSHLTLEKILEHNKAEKINEIESNTKKTILERILSLTKIIKSPNNSDWELRLENELLNKVTSNSWNTPAHICIINQSEECFNLLCKYDAFLELYNLSGHTAKDLLRFNNSKRVKNNFVDKVDRIEEVVVNHMANLIKLTCKNHGVKYQKNNLKNKDHDKLLDKEFKENNEELNKILEKSYHNMGERQLKLENEMREKGSKHINANEVINSEIPVINSKEYLESLFNIDVLSKIPKFKYSKFEKQYKKFPLKAINNLDFNKPINSKYKSFHHTDDYLYIQILIDKSKNEEQELENNIVIEQLKNLKKRYSKFKNGLKLYLLKGFDVKIREKKKLLLCPKIYNSWFLIVFFSDELLFSSGMEIGIDLDYLNISYKDRMRTRIGDEFLEKVQIYKILNNHQKMKIVRHIIEKEFEIESFKEKNLIKEYGLIHNYWLKECLGKGINFYKFMADYGNYYSLLESYTSGFLSMYTYIIYIYMFPLYIIMLLIIGLDFEYTSKLLQTGTLSSPSEKFSIYSSIYMIIFANHCYLLLNTKMAKLKKSLNEKDDFNDNNMNPNYRGQNTVDLFSNNVTKGTLSRTSVWKTSSDNCFFILSIIFTIIIFVFNMMIILMRIGFHFAILDNLHSGERIEDKIRNYKHISIAIPILNFSISKFYNMVIKSIIKKINFRNVDTGDNWIFLYQVIYEVVASVITLYLRAFVSSFTDSSEQESEEIIGKELFSIIVISSLLNATFGLILPIMQFGLGRYNFSGWFFNFFLFPFGCSLCCRKKLKGKIEDLKKDVIKEFENNPKTNQVFSYYILDKPLDSLKEESDLHARGDLSEHHKLNDDEEEQTQKFSEKVKKLEKVQLNENYKEKIDERIFQKDKNIRTRLKEGKKKKSKKLAFYNYVLLFEKIEESTYMMDIEEFEKTAIKTIIIQHSYIISFSFFVPFASVFCTIISLTVVIIFKRSLQNISKRKLAPKKLFNFVSLGIKILNVSFWLGIYLFVTLIFQKYSNEFMFMIGKSDKKSEEFGESLRLARILIFGVGGNIAFHCVLTSWISSTRLQDPERLMKGKREKYWNKKKEFEFFQKIWKENVIGDLDDEKTRYSRDKFLQKDEKFLGEFLQNSGEIENEKTSFGNVNVDFIK